MVPSGMVPFEEWGPLYSKDQANAMKWRYMYVMGRKAFSTEGAVILAQTKPTWLDVLDAKVKTLRDIKVEATFRKHNKERLGPLGKQLIPYCIQTGNPDIAWLYAPSKDYYVPIQAGFLAVAVAIYGRAVFFSFRRARYPIWVRAESSNRRIMKNNIVGMVREYRVDKTKLPFRVPVEFCWF